MADSYRKTLFDAAMNGYVECIEKLVIAGVNVNVKDNCGWTPLIFAANYGYVECVEKLIEVGADVNAKNKYGQTSLMYASESGAISF